MCAGIRGASVGQVPKTALAECRPLPNRPDNGTKLLLSGSRSFMIPWRWTMEFQLPSRHKYERRILSFEETARVLASLEEPNRLIIETCIATGARISEVLGLKWKYVHLDAGTIKIEQRVWQQEVGVPKTDGSRRILGIGELSELFPLE